ncbi:hypothetical protein DKX38_012103 [Salix brachista]|uniref:Pentatricopeptide repeat-containing protein n=1 Tax=Salix brachista TaxID=2182728 RepID=A0A5N5LPG1_9ROSI|nr:hypothetical protein DKX38_012103 [Salix brachista]
MEAHVVNLRAVLCRQLHALYVKAAVDANVFVGTAFLDIYANSELIEKASCILKFMISTLVALIEGLQVHAIVELASDKKKIPACSLVDMYAKCGAIKEAYAVSSMDLFEEMQQMGMHPDEVHLCMGGLVHEAYELMKRWPFICYRFNVGITFGRFGEDASLLTDSQYVLDLEWFIICGNCMKNGRSYSLSDRYFIHLNVMEIGLPNFSHLLISECIDLLCSLPILSAFAQLGSEVIYLVIF